VRVARQSPRAYILSTAALEPVDETARGEALSHEPPNLELEHRPCPCCGGDQSRVVARGRDWEYETCGNDFTFVECGVCGVVYLNPRPRCEDLDVIYPPSYYSTAESTGTGRAGRFVRGAWNLVEAFRSRQLVELLPRTGARVLDIGCGDGRLLRSLRLYGPPGCALSGVDQDIPAPLLRDAAREGITLHDGLYEELPFTPEQFDLIVGQQVVEHALEPGRMLDKVRRELAPGGHAVFDTPSSDALDRRLFGSRYWGGYHFPRHMTLFTPESFGALARRQALEVVSTSRLASPVFWIMTLHNLLADRGAPRALTSRVTYRSVPLLAAATALEMPAVLGARPSSNMRVILRKPARVKGP